MKKMQQKSKWIQIYKIEHKLPLKPSHKDGKLSKLVALLRLWCWLVSLGLLHVNHSLLRGLQHLSLHYQYCSSVGGGGGLLALLLLLFSLSFSPRLRVLAI
jgi:uncharacterized protein (TIGR03382 family)